MSGILDKLPAAVRHLAFSLAALVALALLTWAKGNYASWNLSEPVVGIVAALIPLAIAWVTPLTTQYGLFSDAVVQATVDAVDAPQEVPQDAPVADPADPTVTPGA